jgi:hypothetical protein
MRKTNMLLISLLAAVLVCGVFSLAAAAGDGETSFPSVGSDSVDSSDEKSQVPPDNATEGLEPIYEDENGEPAFYALDDQASPDDTQEPGAADAEEEAQLYMANSPSDSGAPDYALIGAVVGGVLAVVVGGVIGVVYFRKQAKTEN